MVYIKRLTVTGPKKTTSEIVFGEKLNIIYGPSNTGKSIIIKCIDYVFGSSNIPFNQDLGYDTVSLEIYKDGVPIIFTREIDKNNVVVKSQHEKIISGKYSIRSDGIRSSILSLLDIKYPVSIISSSEFKQKKLTWRMIYHIFLLNERKIITENPIIYKEEHSENTSILSAIYYLATGDNLVDKAQQISESAIKAGKTAVLKFIDNEITDLSKRRDVLRKKDNTENDDSKIDISLLSQELKKLDEEIRLKIDQNNKLISEITSLREKLASVTLLLDRYNELKLQYRSDQQRLNFIVDGGITYNRDHQKENVQLCPVCHNTVVEILDKNYLASALEEYRKIERQLIELDDAITNLTQEKDELIENIAISYKEYEESTQKINRELIPHTKSISQYLKEHEKHTQIQYEIDRIEQDIISLSEKRNQIGAESPKNILYHPKDYYSNIQSSLKTILESLLIESNYPKYESSTFDLHDMDIIVNGQKKNTFGKGYCAYLNLIVACGLIYYLEKEGVYHPPFFIADSPVLALKEPESKTENDIEISGKMKEGLFEMLQRKAESFQTIIVDNTIPAIKYGESTNLIKFTKNTESGRYGFLADIR